MHDDYDEVHRNDEEEIAWQNHLDKMVENQIMSDVATRAIEEAKARAMTNEAESPDFIKTKKKGKCQATKWFEGSKVGMVFKTGDQGLGYYKDQGARIVKLAPEIRPMES